MPDLKTSECLYISACCMLGPTDPRKRSVCLSLASTCSIKIRPSCIISYVHHTPAATTAQPKLCPAPDAGDIGQASTAKTNFYFAPGVEDAGQASTPTQQQPSILGGSMTSGEGTSLQSSPSLVPPARLGAALHRQRLVSSQPEGSEESGSVSSNSSHLVPARFQAGQRNIK